jgi:hypothetical protein
MGRGIEPAKEAWTDATKVEVSLWAETFSITGRTSIANLRCAEDALLHGALDLHKNQITESWAVLTP